MTSADRKPLFLMADSQPLFRDGSDSLLPALRESLRVSHTNVTRAAYVGASNGDAPEFFEFFVAAMDGINLHESRMIRASFDDEDRAFLESADLVLLAGGYPDYGWEIMTGTGMDAIIKKKYYAGAVLVGVSAGAVQLGMGWWHGEEDRGVSVGLKLVPHYIDAHDEQDGWAQLSRLVEVREEFVKGFGIPMGGAMIYHADTSIEAVRFPLAEFGKPVQENGKLTRSLLLPESLAHKATDAPGTLARSS